MEFKSLTQNHIYFALKLLMLKFAESATLP